MKILYVQPYVTFTDVLFDTLPRQLAQEGHEVLIVGFFRNRPTSGLVENLRIYPVNAVSLSIPGLINEFPYFLSIDYVIKKFSPDIIHVNNLPFLTTYQVIVAAKNMKVPSVLQVHGVTAERGYFINAFQSLYLKMLGKKIFGSVSRVICLTKNDAQQVQRYGCPADKLSIIPNGVDTTSFKPDSRCAQAGLLIWIGRFVPEKGLTYLIEAVDILVKKSVSNFRLLMIGDGPLKTKIQSQVHMYSLDDYVQFVPSVSHDTVKDFLKRAAIFVIPSLKEGMPYVLLEAMSCGKAVVGSDISGINSVIVNYKNGLLVKPRDPVALSEALLRLLSDDPLRQRLGVAARFSAVNSYDWQIVVSEIDLLYSNVKIH